MKILTVGGGSGGHVTPVAAVIKQLKIHHPEADIRFWCDNRFAPQARSVMAHITPAVPVQTVLAGKLRRYHGVSIGRQLLDVHTVLLNCIDLLKLFIGCLQSLVRLVVWRPVVIFTKGGFVCLPVGIAARLLHIPLVIHDSDTVPGLTNRILGRWAQRILTGSPLENYSYSQDRARYVGVPVAEAFRPRSDREKRQIKKMLGFNEAAPLLVVTGGGQGAQRINDAVVAIAPQLDTDTVSVAHIAGTHAEAKVKQQTEMLNNYRVYGFIADGMPELFGAADLVISRAGANALQELAASAAPTIIVPNGFLTGGHQLKNAGVYRKAKAAIVLDEHVIDKDPQVLLVTIKDLLQDRHYRQNLGSALHQFARPDAAKDTANAIIEVANR